MKTQVKKIGQHRRELIVEVEGEIIKNKFDDVYNRINKEAKVAGFRPGKVPRDILEKHYAATARKQALDELLPELYRQAVGQEQLRPVSMPQIAQVNLQNDNLSFTANLEVKPAIEIKNYKGIKVEYPPIEVSELDLKKAVDKLKQDHNSASDLDLSRSLGYPDFAALQEVLRMQIFLEKTRAQQVSIENSIIEGLLKQANFQVPDTLIAQQSEQLKKQWEMELALRGASKEEIESARPSIEEKIAPEAERQVRVYLILEEIACRENIERDNKLAQRVIEFLLRCAEWDSKGGREK